MSPREDLIKKIEGGLMACFDVLVKNNETDGPRIIGNNAYIDLRWQFKKVELHVEVIHGCIDLYASLCGLRFSGRLDVSQCELWWAVDRRNSQLVYEEASKIAELVAKRLESEIAKAEERQINRAMKKATAKGNGGRL